MKILTRAVAPLFLGAVLATSALASAPALAAPAGADAVFQATTVNLSAYGETRIAPDMATINLGVNTQALTAADAMRANADKMTQVIAALKKQGIAEKDIQTSNIDLNPQYAYEQNKPPRLTGYQAVNQVAIRVVDLKKLGGALDAVVGAGANQINGVSFGLQNPEAAENAARREAVKALAAKADLYAQAAGYRVGRLVNLSEGGGYSPQPPMPMARMMMAKADAAPTPVQGGELSVRIEVNGFYELTK